MLNIERIVDEIALEGVDGITLEYLFKRLRQLNGERPLSAAKKGQIVKCLCRDRELTFRQLSQGRLSAQMFDRRGNWDPTNDQLKVATAPDELDAAYDPYADVSTYTDENTFDAMVRSLEPNKLLDRELDTIVIQASKRQRTASLIKGTTLSSTHIRQLCPKSLYLIEKIARARANGLMQVSLNQIDWPSVLMNSESIGAKKTTSHVHYLIDPIVDTGLITKQAYSYRIGKSTKHQVLLMLTRFHRDFRTKNKILDEGLIELLKQSPGHTMSLTNCRQELGASKDLFKKTYQGLKQKDVIEFIKNDLKIHRKIITVAERDVRLTEKFIKENMTEEVDTDEVNFSLLYKEPIKSQVAAFANHMGACGFTQRDVAREIMRGYGKLESRNIIENMKRENKLAWIKEAGWQEAGRQRHTLYKTKLDKIDNALKFEHLAGFKLSTNQAVITSDSDENNGTSKQQSERELMLVNFIEEHVCVSDMNFFDMVKTIRQAEQHHNIKVDPRTVNRMLDKMDRDGRILIVRRTIYMDNDESSDENSSCEATFYMSTNCSEDLLEQHVNRYRTRKEIDFLLCRKSDRKPIGRTLGEHDIPKFQRLKAVHMYCWYLAYGHQTEVTQRQRGNKPVIYRHDGDDWRKFVPPVTYPNHLWKGWINVGEAYLFVPLSIFRKFTPGAMVNFKDAQRRRFLENNQHSLLRHMPIDYQKLFFFGRHNLGNLFEQLEKLAFMGLITFENVASKWTKPADQMQGNAKFPINFMSKDVFNIYIHQNASILDTRKCEPAKMQIRECELEHFDRYRFQFGSLEDVEHYWSELQNVCTGTRLNRRRFDESGNEVIVEVENKASSWSRHGDSSKTGEMLRKDWFEQHVSRAELQPDDGRETVPPGDGRGAGGFDSWMFTHLERNWLRKVSKPETPQKSRKRTLTSPTKLTLPKSKAKRIGQVRGNEWMKDPNSGMVYRRVPANHNLLEQTKPKPDSEPKKTQKRKRQGGGEVVVIPKRPELESKTSQKRSKTNQDLSVVDQTDRDIITSRMFESRNRWSGGSGKEFLPLGLCKRHRSFFSPTEDQILLKLKIVSTVLADAILTVRFPYYTNTPNHARLESWGNTVIGDNVLRDLLRELSPKVSDKTSSACNRRLTRRLRGERAKHDFYIEKLWNDQFFKDTFSPRAHEVASLIEQNQSEEWRHSEAFLSLYRDIYKYIGEMNMTPVSLGDIPDTLQKLEETYIIKFDAKKDGSTSTGLAEIGWGGEQEYYMMYYSNGKIFQKILHMRDEQMKRTYSACNHPMDISSQMAETVFFSFLFATNNKTRLYDASMFERLKGMIAILLSRATSKSIAPAIRWLIRAKVCKKKPQTETKSLAFGSVKELLDCHLEHIEPNSQTQAKLIDNRIRKSDFEQGAGILEQVKQDAFTVENPKLVSFLILAEQVATGRCKLEIELPDRFVKLSITAEEKAKMEQEAQLACMAEEEDRFYPRRDWETATGSGHGNILGRYRHILVLEGCYDILKDGQKDPPTDPDDLLNETPTQHGGWMNRQTWPHNKRPQIYPATVRCVKTNDEPIERANHDAFHAVELTTETDAKKTIDEFFSGDATLAKRGVLEATIERTKRAVEWLQRIVALGDQCGLTMTDIVRHYEKDTKTRHDENYYSDELKSTPFALDDIGHAIAYSLEIKTIYEVGVSVARFVSHQFVTAWHHDLPELSIRADKCSFCQSGNTAEPENTTHCQCILINTKPGKGRYQLRPWHDLNGQVSTQVFGVFLTPILDAIYHAPGICEEELVAKFDHMCARVTLVEFLRILERAKIIEHERIKYTEPSPVPFCDATKDIIIIAYQAQPNALERVTALLGELKE